MSDHLLSIVLLSPFAGGFAILLVPSSARGLLRGVAIASAIPPLVLSIVLLAGYDTASGGFQFVERYPLVPSLGIQYLLAVDGLSLSLVLLTAFIYLTGITTTWYLGEREKEFFLFLALLVTGVFGVFLSLDLFLFFLFYELAVLPMYVLIGVFGSSMEVPGRGPFGWTFGALRVGIKEYGAMKLTLYLLAGSAFILVGLFLLWVESAELLPQATFDYLALETIGRDLPSELATVMFLLFYLGFGILAGIWPFHTWSPDGHAAAPAAGSMMHAGVLMKLGAYGVLRVGFALLPDAAAELAWFVGTVAVINIVYGAIAAGAQTDIKYLIAYSSVSHMGIVMLGLATLNEPGVAGAVFQMVAHGIMTGLLFTLVNMIYAKAHVRDMTKMGGFAGRQPGLATLFMLAGLSSLGLPGLAGFVAEFLVFLGAYTSAHRWWVFPAVIGAFITAIYVMRAMNRIFLGPPNPDFDKLEDARGMEWVTLVVLGGMLVVFGLYPRLLLDSIQGGVVEFLARWGA
ncbi:MAG TPA: NADH-quinone oxidoreductase subunit M [Candidatus Polarisedimenticolaceae bacterium]|nr:NADH-quinone oxidoreductase subunit M [Candidatus Polarisedimenticolaceae bacterium]